MTSRHHPRARSWAAIAAFGAVSALPGLVRLDAATGTSSFSATVTVLNECSIETTPLALGAYDPVVTNKTTPKDASGAVAITCTKGATATIALGLGLYASGSQRRMNAGTAYLQYEIYQGPSYATVWGTGANALTPAAAPDYNQRSFTAYGRIPAGQDVPAGSYSDTVVATVTF